jgi:hypothetical protein
VFKAIPVDISGLRGLSVIVDTAPTSERVDIF